MFKVQCDKFVIPVNGLLTPLEHKAMASGDIAQITEALAKTHVGEVELSYKGRGLKLDNVESGE